MVALHKESSGEPTQLPGEHPRVRSGPLGDSGVGRGESPVRAVYAARENIYTATPLHIDIKGWYMPVIKMAYKTL